MTIEEFQMIMHNSSTQKYFEQTLLPVAEKTLFNKLAMSIKSFVNCQSDWQKIPKEMQVRTIKMSEILK